MAGQPDYYEILQVHPKASADIIKRAYRTLSRAYHPDANPPDKRAWAQQMMSRLNEAYRVLSDPEARRQYDAEAGVARGGAVRSNGQRAASSPLSAVKNCYWHPNRPRVSVCTICGKSVCAECRRTDGMAVLCPECAGARTTTVEDAVASEQRNVGTPKVTDRGPRVIEAFRELARADWLEQTLFGLLLVALGFLLLGLWIAGFVAIIAIRFPGHLGSVLPLSIVAAVLTVAGLAAALGTLKAFRHPFAVSGCLLAGAGLTVWLFHGVLDRPFVQVAEDSFKRGDYTQAAVQYSYASWRGSAPKADLDRGLGLSYLGAFRLSTEGWAKPGNPILARGALLHLSRYAGETRPVTEEVNGKGETKFSKPLRTIPLAAEEVAAVYLAATTTANAVRADKTTWAQAINVLNAAWVNGQDPAEYATRNLYLGLACYQQSKAVRTEPREMLQRGDRAIQDWVDRAASARERNETVARGDREKTYRDLAKKHLQDREANSAIPRAIPGLADDLKTAKEDLGVAEQKKDEHHEPGTEAPASDEQQPALGRQPQAQGDEESRTEAIQQSAQGSASGEGQQTNSEPPYIGNRNTMKFHLPDCEYLPERENQVPINSLEEARKRGYSPCEHCNPDKATKHSDTQ